MKHAIAALALIGAACTSCSKQTSATAVTPANWSCASIIDPVIQTSKDGEVKLLEITRPHEVGRIPNQALSCTGLAEWSQGDGAVAYQAHIRDGGHVVYGFTRMDGM